MNLKSKNSAFAKNMRSICWLWAAVGALLFLVTPVWGSLADKERVSEEYAAANRAYEAARAYEEYEKKYKQLPRSTRKKYDKPGPPPEHNSTYWDKKRSALRSQLSALLQAQWDDTRASWARRAPLPPRELSEEELYEFLKAQAQAKSCSEHFRQVVSTKGMQTKFTKWWGIEKTKRGYDLLMEIERYDGSGAPPLLNILHRQINEKAKDILWTKDQLIKMLKAANHKRLLCKTQRPLKMEEVVALVTQKKLHHAVSEAQADEEEMAQYLLWYEAQKQAPATRSQVICQGGAAGRGQ